MRGEAISESGGLKGHLRGKQGVSVLAIVFVLLVLTATGYTFTAMMVAKQKSVPVTLDSSRAHYIAEAGMNYAGKYLLGLVNWNTAIDQTKNFGGGSFIVTFSDYSSGSPESIVVTSTGEYGIGQRVHKATFER